MTLITFDVNNFVTCCVDFLLSTSSKESKIKFNKRCYITWNFNEIKSKTKNVNGVICKSIRLMQTFWWFNTRQQICYFKINWRNAFIYLFFINWENLTLSGLQNFRKSLKTQEFLKPISEKIVKTEVLSVFVCYCNIRTYFNMPFLYPVILTEYIAMEPRVCVCIYVCMCVCICVCRCVRVWQRSHSKGWVDFDEILYKGSD